MIQPEIRHNRTRSSLVLSLACAALLWSGVAGAQAPASSPPAVASPDTSPTHTPTAEETAANTKDSGREELAALRKQAARMTDDLRKETTYRVERARDIFTHDELASDLEAEIGRTLDRGVDHVEVQLARIESAGAATGEGGREALVHLQDELAAMETVAERAGDDIADVLTRGGPTEDNLQRIASEIRKVGERAEELSERLEERLDETPGNAENVRINVTTRTKERNYGGDGDYVRFGGGILVEAGKQVKDAVAFGGPVTVEGTVEGDAVAFGGDVRVTESGRVKGDAASFGGRVTVEEGGRVDGERVNMGPSGIAKVLAGATAPRRNVMSTPAKIGARMLGASVQFITFFLLGLLVLVLVPERTDRIAEELGEHPVKSGGLGLLLVAFALPLVSVLLAVTIIGLVPLVFVVYPGAFLAAFVGYVALALAVGRKIPANIVPTRTALFALGAAVIVVVGLIPVFGKVLWLLAGIAGVGAVVMTRFGQPPEEIPPPAPPAEAPAA